MLLLLALPGFPGGVSEKTSSTVLEKGEPLTPAPLSSSYRGLVRQTLVKTESPRASSGAIELAGDRPIV